MSKREAEGARQAPTEAASGTESTSKKHWQEPKLRFLEPKLTKHGAMQQVTAGFFGTFST